MKKNLCIYVPAALAVCAMKIFYRTADCNMLLWILTPTMWWVRVLSGIPFEYYPNAGYVSHAYRFIIAPSCAGVRFLLLVFVMLVFSFTHLLDSRRKKIGWLGFCAVFSYAATVFVNGIRITVSVYLPLILADRGLMTGWLTAERLHTIIGTAVYFSMLFVIYLAADKCCNRVFRHRLMQEENAANMTVRKNIWVSPVFWYFVMVLAVPFLGRLYRKDWTGFGQYALLVTAVCGCVVLLLGIWGTLRKLRK